MLSIRKAGIEDIELIRSLTFKIWPQTYSTIISKEQVNYMLEMMYSVASLQKQMHEQHHFILCYENEAPVGFASYNHVQDNNYKLHKLYVLPSAHGKGAGRLMVDEILKTIVPAGGKTLCLNVNRNNPAVHFYTKLGFTITKEEDIDIGRGYYMNDYVMSIELCLPDCVSRRE